MSHEQDTTSEELAQAARRAFEPTAEELARTRAALGHRLAAEPSGVWPTGTYRLLLPGALALVVVGAAGWLAHDQLAGEDATTAPPSSVQSVATPAPAAQRDPSPVTAPGEPSEGTPDTLASSPPLFPPERSPTPELSASAPTQVRPSTRAVLPVPHDALPPEPGPAPPTPVATVSSGRERASPGGLSPTSSSATGVDPPESILAREAARLMRARAAIREGRPAEALALTTPSPDGDPLSPERRAVRALAYCGLGRVETARRVAGRLVEGAGPSGVALRASCVGTPASP